MLLRDIRVLQGLIIESSRLLSLGFITISSKLFIVSYTTIPIAVVEPVILRDIRIVSSCMSPTVRVSIYINLIPISS